MVPARAIAFILGVCLSLFATLTSASLNLSLTVTPDSTGLCPGGSDGYRWSVAATTSPGDVGPMFFTVYDVGDVCTVEPSANWNGSSPLLGATPSGLSVTDDSSTKNVSFACGGSTGCTGMFSGINDFILPIGTGSFAYAWQDVDSTGSPQYGTGMFNTTSTTVPEPATLALLGVGLAGPAFAQSRKRHLIVATQHV